MRLLPALALFEMIWSRPQLPWNMHLGDRCLLVCLIPWYGMGLIAQIVVDHLLVLIFSGLFASSNIQTKYSLGILLAILRFYIRKESIHNRHILFPCFDHCWICFSIFELSVCFKVLGLPSAKTSPQQYFIENSAIWIKIGARARPFSVMEYSTRGGVSG